MTLRVKIHERVVYIIQERIFGTSKLPKALQDGLVVLEIVLSWVPLVQSWTTTWNASAASLLRFESHRRSRTSASSGMPTMSSLLTSSSKNS
jgi:hypothetical protein